MDIKHREELKSIKEYYNPISIKKRKEKKGWVKFEAREHFFFFFNLWTDSFLQLVISNCVIPIHSVRSWD